MPLSELKKAVKDLRTEGLSYALRRQDKSVSRSIIVLGGPRSGSTWLQEVLASITGLSPVYEPLRWGTDRSLPHRGLADGFWAPDESAGDPQMRHYFEEILAGRRLSHWSATQTSLTRHAGAEGVLVKLIRANRAANWLGKNFPEATQVRIVRNPLSTVSSMKFSPGPWHQWSLDVLAALAFGSLANCSVVLGRSRPSRTALLTAWWWAETRPFIGNGTGTYDVRPIRYEQLVQRDYSVLEALCALAGLEPEEFQRSGVFDRASITANSSTQHQLRDANRSRLGEKDREIVENTLERLGAYY